VEDGQHEHRGEASKVVLAADEQGLGCGIDGREVEISALGEVEVVGEVEGTGSLGRQLEVAEDIPAGHRLHQALTNIPSTATIEVSATHRLATTFPTLCEPIGRHSQDGSTSEDLPLGLTVKDKLLPSKYCCRSMSRVSLARMGMCEGKALEAHSDCPCTAAARARSRRRGAMAVVRVDLLVD
jgi:hypothetical protein